jgi:CIC family chloride channel protein
MRSWGDTGAVMLAFAIGLGGGAGAIFFRYLIAWIDRLFFGGGRSALAPLGEAYVVVLPAIGLVLVNEMVRRWAPEAQGHGVPEVMYAVKKRGGRIRPRVAVIKALASALCIGSGGSVGREGPIVQIGCSFGSTLAQLLKLSPERTRLLVVCGAAAGIGGTFNAPVGGVLFAMEVILGSFAARSFGLVVVSSVTATALCRAVLGTAPAFRLTQVFVLRSALELPAYVVLGLLTGLVSLLYVKTLYSFEFAFQRWSWPSTIKALLGGLGVGAVGYVGIRYLGGRYLFGLGYDAIQATIAVGEPLRVSPAPAGRMAVAALLLLIPLKVVATSLTLAAGGSGGVFAPALFIGAMSGGAFGELVHLVLPSVSAPPGAYALVGMAAVFAGSAHAPITSILILFEMTGDYKIILPLMIAVVISYLVVSATGRDSIYAVKLRRLGGLQPTGAAPSVLDLVVVADAMSRDYATTAPHTPVDELATRFHREHVRSLAVLDEADRLVGIVTEDDVAAYLMKGNYHDATASDIMTGAVITCTPDQRLREVLHMLHAHDVGQIPVVDPRDRSKLLGVLRRQEIFWAYGELAAEHERLLRETGAKTPIDEGDLVHLELSVPSDDTQLSSRKIQEIGLPRQCLIVTLRRENRTMVPSGATVLESGDQLTLVATRTQEPLLRQWVRDHSRASS